MTSTLAIFMKDLLLEHTSCSHLKIDEENLAENDDLHHSTSQHSVQSMSSTRSLPHIQIVSDTARTTLKPNSPFLRRTTSCPNQKERQRWTSSGDSSCNRNHSFDSPNATKTKDRILMAPPPRKRTSVLKRKKESQSSSFSSSASTFIASIRKSSSLQTFSHSDASSSSPSSSTSLPPPPTRPAPSPPMMTLATIKSPSPRNSTKKDQGQSIISLVQRLSLQAAIAITNSSLDTSHPGSPTETTSTIAKTSSRPMASMISSTASSGSAMPTTIAQ